MSLHTDPTYLRTINDGLLSGAVHKDNASALPQGLVGMYEEALPPASNVRVRTKFLEFFAVWALLKKEVSTPFLVPLLVGWSEDEVLDYIAQYSKWFNSPTGGTYVLYHERLRAFVLQKISHGQFMACNEAIINQCRVSLQAKAGDEWERYALEHFSSHLLIDGMISGDGSYLKSFCRSRDVWERQIELSSGLNWSILSIKNLIEFYSKYDPTECQEDYHNLLQLQQRSREFIRQFNSIDVNCLNEGHINKISRINIDNEYDSQYLYVSIIVKMHRILSSNLEIANCKGLIVKLDETLGRLQSIEHGKLNFHDVFPFSYFQELLFFYSTIDLTTKNLPSGTYKLTDYEQGEYYPHKNYDEFIGSQFSFDLFPNNISPEILDAIQAIQHNAESLNLSEIESLGQLYSFLEGLEIAGLDLPNALMIIPVLFSKNFQTNKRFDFIRSEWKLDVCECYASNITSFAFLLCQAASDVNSDSVSIQKEIDWFAMNWLSSHKYDIDVYLSFVSEHIFWQRGLTEFENWILEMLYNRTDSDLISLIDDQKYQVMVDFYWGDDKSLNENLTKVISPFQVRYYKDEAESSKLAEFDGAIITVEETYGMNAKEFLQSDFGTGPYIRSLRSVNSPVSVKNIDWFQILPKLKEADTKTLYATMHKVYTKKLCYTNLSWADLPDNAQGFYNLHWVTGLPSLGGDL